MRYVFAKVLIMLLSCPLLGMEGGQSADYLTIISCKNSNHILHYKILILKQLQNLEHTVL